MNPTMVDVILDAPPLAVIAVKATLLLAAAWGLHFCLARLSPRWRVALWRGVAVGLLLLPLLARYAPALRAPLLPAPEPPQVIALPDVISLPPLPEPSRIELPSPSAIEVAPSAEPIRWGAWLGAGWALGAALLALRFALAQRAMRRLIRAAAPAPAQIQRLFAETAARLGVPGVRLAVSGQVRSPLLHGLRRPVVLLPERMTQPAFAADLPAIFAHELTHAASGDLAWLGLIRLVQFAAWPHPLTWGMHAASAAATERACDAAAAGALEDRDAYSRSLARVALALAGRPVNSVALAMAIPDIRRRLLALRRAPTAPCRAAIRLAALAGLALLAALGALRPVQAEPKAAEEKPATETVLQLRRGEEKRWRNLTLRGIRMTEGKERRRNEGAVEFSIDTGAQIENRSMQELTSEYVDDYKITVEDVKAKPDSSGDGVARIRIQYLPAMAAPGADPRKPSTPPGSEVVFKLKQGEEKLWRDFKLRVTSILVPQRNDAKRQGRDGSVEFTIDFGDKIENRSMQVFYTEYIGDYKVTIEDVRGAGKSGEGSARFRIKHMDPAKQAGDLKKAEEALIAKAPDGGLIVRIYKINEKDGPRIKSLINSLLMASGKGALSTERKLFVDRDDLIVRDTPENIRKIEALLLDKKFIKSESTLETAHFSLSPRDKAASTTQTRVFALRVVEAIKVFLHSQAGEAQANSKGRSLKFDDQSLQLTIIDTPTNLARVGQYIDSLPELGLKTRQEVLFLKHATAADLAVQLEQILKKTGGKGETTIRPFGERNALIVRYQNPAVFQEILDLVRQLDQPTPPKGDDREARLNIENFTLAPRAGDVASEKSRNFAERVVEALKVFLYAQPNEYQAGKEGRRLWFDPQTMQLTIVDTDSNLARVRQYLKSIPELQEADEFSIMIPLTHQPAGKMAAGITRILEAMEQREQADAAAKGKPASARRIARVSESPELRPAEGRNALFVSSRTRGSLKDIEDMVAQLDKPEIPKAYQSFFDSAPGPEGALSLAHAAPGGIK